MTHDPDTGRPIPQDPWHVFRRWHTTEALWREIYARTVAALIAALGIYLVAVLAGGANKKPAVLGLAVVIFVGVALLVFSVPVAVRHWEHVRPLFRVWIEDPAPEAVLARKVYNRLVFGFFTTLVGVVLLLAVLFAA